MKTQISKEHTLIILENFLKHQHICNKVGAIAGPAELVEPDYCPMLDGLFGSQICEMEAGGDDKYWDLLHTVSDMNEYTFKGKAEIMYSFLVEYVKKDFNQN